MVKLLQALLVAIVATLVVWVIGWVLTLSVQPLVALGAFLQSVAGLIGIALGIYQYLTGHYKF